MSFEHGDENVSLRFFPDLVRLFFRSSCRLPSFTEFSMSCFGWEWRGLFFKPDITKWNENRKITALSIEFDRFLQSLIKFFF